MSRLEFEWDDANRAHLKKHRVAQEEFEQVMRNEPFDLHYDIESGEERYTALGCGLDIASSANPRCDGLPALEAYAVDFPKQVH